MNCDIGRSKSDSVMTVFVPIVFNGLNWDGSPERIEIKEISK